MSGLGWLHLTDFHVGTAAHAWLWPNIRELFFDDLATLHEKCGPWDLILFSGDLAHAGTADDYRKFASMLKELQVVLQAQGSDPVLLAVPGNHDLVRPVADRPEVIVLTHWRDKALLHADSWGAEESPYRRLVDSSFANYTSWWQSTPRGTLRNYHDGLLPGDFSATYLAHGMPIGILGLNTAFLQMTGGSYEGKLAVVPSQFSAACDGDGPGWAARHHLCLLMTHHPPSWLTPRSLQHLNGEIAPPGRFAIHMFGHMHSAAIRTEMIGGAAPRRLWQGPSLFGLEHWGDRRLESRTHGYSAGRLEFEPDEATASLRHWPRRARRHAEGY